MDPQVALVRLGKLITNEVRDPTISDLDDAFKGIPPDIYSKHIYSKVQELPPECLPFIQELIPYIVDMTIRSFLSLFDEHQQEVVLQIKDTTSLVDAAAATESLVGEYSGFWVRAFITERSNTLRTEAERLSRLHHPIPKWNIPPATGDSEPTP